jgi:ribose transport system permease protein
MTLLRGSIRSNLGLGLPALILAIVVAGVAALGSEAFPSPGNLGNLVNRVLPLGLVALGETIVLIGGRIDLSVGTIVSLATSIMALWSVDLGWTIVPLTLGAGVLCGLFTACGVVWLRINPLIMSLATSAIVKGVTLLILPSPGGEVDYNLYEALFGLDGPLGVPLLLLIVLFALAFVILGWTRFGRSLYALGSDSGAAFANGVAVARMDFAAFALSGLLASAAGVALSIRILSGDPLIGESYTLDAVAAAILGGVALKGGRGNVLGVLIAVTALVLVDNSFNLMALNTNVQGIAKGLIFVLALVFFMRGKAGEGA